jgi:hypothetical protein
MKKPWYPTSGNLPDPRERYYSGGKYDNIPP